MCCYHGSVVNTKGELGGGDHSKSNGDRPTLACHSVDPVGILRTRLPATERLGDTSSKHSSHLRVRIICAINVHVTKARIGANDALLHL